VREPEHVARAIARLGSSTSCSRWSTATTCSTAAPSTSPRRCAGCTSCSPSLLVETLVGDFQGHDEAIDACCDGNPDVFAHNVETVRRLTRTVRDVRSSYEQTLRVLERAKQRSGEFARSADKRPMLTKSSIMVGLGETDEEVLETMRDLRQAGVDVVTLGQYLRPTPKHHEVKRFVTPETFAEYEREAEAMGFLHCSSGPLVRSSYKAAEVFLRALLEPGADVAAGLEERLAKASEEVARLASEQNIGDHERDQARAGLVAREGTRVSRTARSSAVNASSSRYFTALTCAALLAFGLARRLRRRWLDPHGRRARRRRRDELDQLELASGGDCARRRRGRRRWRGWRRRWRRRARPRHTARAPAQRSRRHAARRELHTRLAGALARGARRGVDRPRARSRGGRPRRLGGHGAHGRPGLRVGPSCPTSQARVTSSPTARATKPTLGHAPTPTTPSERSASPQRLGDASSATSKSRARALPLLPRTVRVLVPAVTPTHVLYAHDGQNLFDPDAPSSVAGRSIRARRASMMIVGIDNTAARMSDYTHVADDYGSGLVGGDADEYAELVETVVRPLDRRSLRRSTEAWRARFVARWTREPTHRPLEPHGSLGFRG
jgi:hypothetical protein